jgi:hypothetical protein
MVGIRDPVNQKPCDADATARIGDNEVNELYVLARRIEEQIPNNAPVFARDKQPLLRRPLQKPFIRKVSHAIAIALVQCQHLRDPLITRRESF